MNTENDAWEACPAGEISHMVGRMHGKKVRLLVTRIVSVSACLVAFVVATAIFSGVMPSASVVEKITCADCKRRLPDYLNQALAEVAVEQVEVHLDDCPNCKHLHDQMKQADPSTLFPKSSNTSLVALASNVH